MNAKDRLIEILTREARSARRSLQLMEAGSIVTRTNGQDTTAESIEETKGRIGRLEEGLRRLQERPDVDELAVWIELLGVTPPEKIGKWVTFDVDEASRAIDVVVHGSQDEAEAAAIPGQRLVGWIGQDGRHVCLVQ